MKWNASAVCHIGKKRTTNQDNLLFCGEIRAEACTAPWVRQKATGQGAALFAICDGMGGTQNGGVAALQAVQVLQQASAEASSAQAMALLQQANMQICQRNAQEGADSGTTCVLAVLGEGQVHIVNIGDSRAYHCHKGCLTQISHDHTEYQRRKQMGFTDEALAKTPQVHHLLTQHLGIVPSVMQIEPFCAPAQPWRRGDAVLLCSDGLTGMVSDAQIAKIVRRRWASAAKKVETLLALALQQGGTDNITIVLIEHK